MPGLRDDARQLCRMYRIRCLDLLQPGKNAILADRIARQLHKAPAAALQPSENAAMDRDGRRVEILRFDSAEPFGGAAAQGPRTGMPRVPGDKIDKLPKSGSLG